MDSTPILRVRNLRTYFSLDEGTLKAVDGVDFDLPQRLTLGMIGESGCGKSVTAYSIMRTVLPPGKIVDGTLELRQADGAYVDLATLDPFGAAIRAIRGKAQCRYPRPGAPKELNRAKPTDEEDMNPPFVSSVAFCSSEGADGGRRSLLAWR